MIIRTLLIGPRVCGAGIARFVTFIEVGRNVMYNFDDITCRRDPEPTLM
jgi:hypothetical protein